MMLKYVRYVSDLSPIQPHFLNNGFPKPLLRQRLDQSNRVSS